MLKENGRDKKVDYKEYAKDLMRVFKCANCNETASFKSIQFGEVIKCPTCDGVMYEDVVKD